MTSSSLGLPLEGIRVADITVVAAGTNGATLLADWGAEVIRVEPIGRLQPSTRGAMAHPSKTFIDSIRGPWMAYPDWEPGERPFNRFVIYHAHGRSKRSVTADLSRPEGVETFKKLISISDVFIENNVPSTIEGLGIDYPHLRQVKPDLIMLRMPAYGLTGPRRGYRSYGPHLEGSAGHTYIRGYPDLDPSNNEDTYLGDVVAAAVLAFAVAMAVRRQRKTGKGGLIECAQLEALLPSFGEMLLDYQMNGRVAQPQGNDLFDMAPHNAYQCEGDDRWVAIAVGNDAEWQGMVRAMGSPDWASDPRFSTQSARFEHRRELDELVTKWTLQRTDRMAMEILQAYGVPAGVLNDDRDILYDPQFDSRGFFDEMEAPDCPRIRYPGIIWKMARTPNSVKFPPAALGQHNEFGYKELLGFSDSQYRDYESMGQIGTDYPAHIP